MTIALKAIALSIVLFLPGSVPAQSAGSNPLGLAMHHVTVGVASIRTERAFYHDVLGFEVGPFRQRPKYDHQQMLIPGFRIDMIEQKGSVRPAAAMGTDKQGWLHLAFTLGDVLSAYHQLQAKGVPVAPGRMDGDRIGSFYVTDPEGNRLELAAPEPHP